MNNKETGFKEKDDYTIKGIREFLEKGKLDSVIICNPINIGYLCNYFDTIALFFQGKLNRSVFKLMGNGLVGLYNKVIEFM